MYRKKDNEESNIDHLDFPLEVNKITVQKKNKTRFSLYANDEFLLGVSDSVLTSFDLRKGSLISQEQYDLILQAEERWNIREYLIGLLSRRDHATKELQLKSLKKGFNKALIQDCLDELESKGYINNEAFAKKFIHDKFEFNGWGTSKIRNELIKKGIDPSVIERILDADIAKEDVVQSMNQLTAKKKPSLLRTESKKRRKKLFDFLHRKGYDTTVILQEIDRLLKSIET